ncbi:hypothetical protein FGO68_gene4210 [Halteria grandinella]|uniref:PH domain-containing protein n=1 Tax=Halteria grandinella TaxID=5974 RepID=A0A8J8P066_HALGN|nr:hypothetical protein FGO68_gene4210 [Halteria grandinella]
MNNFLNALKGSEIYSLAQGFHSNPGFTRSESTMKRTPSYGSLSRQESGNDQRAAEARAPTPSQSSNVPAPKQADERLNQGDNASAATVMSSLNTSVPFYRHAWSQDPQATSIVMNPKHPIHSFEDAFPEYNGPKKLFGVFKKKQKGGIGMIISKWSTRYVDLNFPTGVFSYMSKAGKQQRIQFKDFEDIFVHVINEDPECPKGFPFSFSFRSRIPGAQPATRYREYQFACQTKAERDIWLQGFDMLIEFRKILQVQLQKKNAQSASPIKGIQVDIKQEISGSIVIPPISNSLQPEIERLQEEIQKRQALIEEENKRLEQQAAQIQQQTEEAKKMLENRKDYEEEEDGTETESGDEIEDGEFKIPERLHREMSDQPVLPSLSDLNPPQIQVPVENQNSPVAQVRGQDSNESSEEQTRQAPLKGRAVKRKISVKLVRDAPPRPLPVALQSTLNAQTQEEKEIQKPKLQLPFKQLQQPPQIQTLNQQFRPPSLQKYQTPVNGGFGFNNTTSNIVLKKSQITNSAPKGGARLQSSKVQTIIDRENERDDLSQSDEANESPTKSSTVVASLRSSSTRPMNFMSLHDEQHHQRDEARRQIFYKAGVNQDFNDIINMTTAFSTTVQTTKNISLVSKQQKVEELLKVEAKKEQRRLQIEIENSNSNKTQAKVTKGTLFSTKVRMDESFEEVWD